MRCFKNASKRIFSMCMLIVLISIPNYIYSGVGIRSWQSFGLGTLFVLAGLVTADYASTFAGHMSVYLKEKDRLDKEIHKLGGLVNCSKTHETCKHVTKEVTTTITTEYTQLKLYIYSLQNREEIIKKWEQLCEVYDQGVSAKNKAESSTYLAAVLFAVSLYNYMQSVRFS